GGKTRQFLLQAAGLLLKDSIGLSFLVTQPLTKNEELLVRWGEKNLAHIRILLPEDTEAKLEQFLKGLRTEFPDVPEEFIKLLHWMWQAKTKVSSDIQSLISKAFSRISDIQELGEAIWDTFPVETDIKNAEILMDMLIQCGLPLCTYEIR